MFSYMLVYLENTNQTNDFYTVAKIFPRNFPGKKLASQNPLQKSYLQIRMYSVSGIVILEKFFHHAVKRSNIYAISKIWEI